MALPSWHGTQSTVTTLPFTVNQNEVFQAKAEYLTDE
jgi:hypothetical protein